MSLARESATHQQYTHTKHSMAESEINKKERNIKEKLFIICIHDQRPIYTVYIYIKYVREKSTNGGLEENQIKNGTRIKESNHKN